MAAGTELSPEQLQALLAAVSFDMPNRDDSSIHTHAQTGRDDPHSGHRTIIMRVDSQTGKIEAMVVGVAPVHFHGGSEKWGVRPGVPGAALRGFTARLGAFSNVYTVPRAGHGPGYPITGVDLEAGLLGPAGVDADVFGSSGDDSSLQKVSSRENSRAGQVSPHSDAILEAILEAELKGLNSYVDAVSEKVEGFLAKQATKAVVSLED